MLINHKRFKTIGKPKKSLFYKFPHIEKKYFEFFNNYAKKNYQWVDTNCPCKNNDDILLSKVDRCGVEYHTAVCKMCGLIRGKKYLRDIDAKNFYEFHWRNIIIDGEKEIEPEIYFENLFKSSTKKIEIIKKYGNLKLTKNSIILDLGGGVGATAYHFLNQCEIVLADFFEPYLEFAKTKGIKVIKGGLHQVNFKPDVVIMSHVIEHWSNFEQEIKKLISIQKINQTINYVEFPGIDSLKLGRREADVLGDIHIPHVYYFSSYVFENLMGRYGFKKLYLDSEIRGLFVYTGNKIELENYFDKVKEDLIIAEKKRKHQGLKNFVKFMTPKILLELKRKFLKKNINY